MLESNLKLVNNDVKVLIKDAQDLFQAAATLSGEKAEEVRSRAMKLLDAAMAKTQEARKNAMVVGKELAVSADGFVKERPWQVMAAAAGVGILAGYLVARK